MLIGKASVALGAGRSFLGESIDPAVGIIFTKKGGDKVKRGEPLALFHYRDNNRLARALALAEKAFIFSDKIPPKKKMILGKI